MSSETGSVANHVIVGGLIMIVSFGMGIIPLVTKKIKKAGTFYALTNMLITGLNLGNICYDMIPEMTGDCSVNRKPCAGIGIVIIFLMIIESIFVKEHHHHHEHAHAHEHSESHSHEHVAEMERTQKDVTVENVGGEKILETAHMGAHKHSHCSHSSTHNLNCSTHNLNINDSCLHAKVNNGIFDNEQASNITAHEVEAVNVSDENKEKKDLHHCTEIEVAKLGENQNEEEYDDADNFQQSHFTYFNETGNIFSICTFVFAISLHSILEGLDTTCSSIFSMHVVGLLLHKGAESLAIGMALFNSKIKKIVALVVFTFYTILTPVSIFIGRATRMKFAAVAGYFKALALGSLMYVVFFEGMSHGLHGKHKALKYCALSVGYGLSVLIIALAHESEGHSHSHGHGH